MYGAPIRVRSEGGRERGVLLSEPMLHHLFRELVGSATIPSDGTNPLSFIMQPADLILGQRATMGDRRAKTVKRR